VFQFPTHLSPTEVFRPVRAMRVFRPAPRLKPTRSAADHLPTEGWGTRSFPSEEPTGQGAAASSGRLSSLVGIDGPAFRPWRSSRLGRSSGRGLGRRRTNERMRSRCHMPPADRLAPGGGSAIAAVEPPFVLALEVAGPGTPAAQVRRPLRRRSRGEGWPQCP
jgi:hypothetical protein